MKANAFFCAAISRNMRTKLKNAAFIILSVAVGAFFIYSAYTKMVSLQYFEYTLVDHLHFSWLASAIAARLFIGLEIALGVVLILNVYGGRKWILKFTTGLLLVFTAYIAYLWAVAGKDVNCGCMGDTVLMKPIPSIIKNIILLLAIWGLYRFHAGITKRLVLKLTLPALLIITAIPFITLPIPGHKPQWLNNDQFALDMTPLYKNGTDTPAVNLRKGKHVLAFLSLSCPHCKTAAYKLQLMKKNNPGLPIFFVLAGKEQYKQPFWEYTQAQHVPHIQIDGDAFINMVGYSWPVIYLVRDGEVTAQANYIELDQQGIEKWLAQP